MPQSLLTLSVFMIHIGSQMPSKWRMFGVLLDIPWSELDTYPAHSCVDCFAHVFDTWEKKGSPEFSWETVISVLESPLLQERRLSHKVRRMMSDGARGLLCDPAFSPGVTPTGEQLRTPSLTSHAMNTGTPVQEISLSYANDNVPSISPMAVTALMQGQSSNHYASQNSSRQVSTTDGQLSLQRPHLHPGNFPLGNGQTCTQRRGLTSSHNSYVTPLSVVSHVSHTSDGSTTTETLC